MPFLECPECHGPMVPGPQGAICVDCEEQTAYLDMLMRDERESGDFS